MINAMTYLSKHFTFDPSQTIVELPDFGRNELAQMFAELHCKSGAEIGVQNGDYSEVLCKANPSAKIYSIDGWRHYKGYHFITTQAQQDANREVALARLAPYPKNIIIRKDSLEAAREMKPRSLDFVYIDANHDYEHVTEDLTAWSAVVKRGGIVSGHDYIERKGRFAQDMQVVRALGDFTRVQDIRPLFILGTRAIHPDEIRDRPRSWMFINP